MGASSQHPHLHPSPGPTILLQRKTHSNSLETTSIGLGSKSDDRAKGPFQETPVIANSCNPTPTVTAPSPSRDILLSGSPGDSNATVKLNAKERRTQRRKDRKKRIAGIGAIPDAAPKLTIPDIWASKEVTSPGSPALTIILPKATTPGL
ncbi:hypothetical protein NDU88_007227 [Pleurodeles waltl]|uniref:Uncharacterized protein n=1 Tax=Pleurodeles waltl TaxID=8319 RepID=A0AAV7NT18_PLEWA|nr:hypothetical protein NDU88_007227 [Pleurodeles waltl]